MICPLMHDPMFLAQKSKPASADDAQTARNLLDTLKANEAHCVGMAANMIGVLRCIIVLMHEGKPMLMYNPELLRCAEPYETEEGCLSLLGGPRPVKRFRKIKVQYQNEQLQTRIRTFSGLSAQIIQHEIDHCNGVLI